MTTIQTLVDTGSDAFAANAAVIRRQDQMLGSLLDRDA